MSLPIWQELAKSKTESKKSKTESKVKSVQGYGLCGPRGTRRGRRASGRGAVFFNNPRELLTKLELIIGESSAGNNNIKMRDRGVSVLDTSLKT